MSYVNLRLESHRKFLYLHVLTYLLRCRQNPSVASRNPTYLRTLRYDGSNLSKSSRKLSYIIAIVISRCICNFSSIYSRYGSSIFVRSLLSSCVDMYSSSVIFQYFRTVLVSISSYLAARCFLYPSAFNFCIMSIPTISAAYCVLLLKVYTLRLFSLFL